MGEAYVYPTVGVRDCLRCHDTGKVYDPRESARQLRGVYVPCPSCGSLPEREAEGL